MPHKYTFPNIRVRGVTKFDGPVYVNGVELGSETGGTARPYKVYVALLNQSGENPPVATVLENELDGVPEFVYLTEGRYMMTLAGAFPFGKLFILPIHIGSSGGLVGVSHLSDSELMFEYGTDGSLQDASLELRVYD